MRKTTFAILACLIVIGAPAYADDVAAPAPLAPCAARDVAVHVDGRSGAFDGMSHSGTTVILRNASRRACSVDAFPGLAFFTRRGKALPVTVDHPSALAAPIVNGRPLPMGHGPVVLPLTVAPGASVTADLHWVSAAVFDRSVCVDAARLALTAGGGAATARIAAHICGPDGAHLTVTATRLTPRRT